MTSGTVIWILALWLLACNVLGYILVQKALASDPEFFDYGDEAALRRLMPRGTSRLVWDLLWDSDLPGEAFRGFQKYGLYVMRIMYALTVPLTLCLIFFG
jgi:hypothetical protein